MPNQRLYFILIALVLCKASTAQQFNPIVADNIADPSIVQFKDTFYLYATTDIDHGLATAGLPVVWKSTDFVNWHFDGILDLGIDWKKPWTFTDDKGKQKTGYFRYWAPGKPIFKNNQYHLFVTIVQPDDKLGTYALVADRPEGPFHFTNGSGLYFNDSAKKAAEAVPVVNDIDGEPFVDDNGKTYLYWRRRFATKLSDDLLQTEGEPVSISTKYPGYSEGPGLFKRKDLYYYWYTLSGHASYCNGYMISHQGPLGPFETPAGNNIFIFSDTAAHVWGPGHGNVFQLPGTDEFIFLYLEYGEGGTTRQVYANRMHFNTDGTIQPIAPNQQGVGYLGTHTDHRKNLARNATVTASSYRLNKSVNASIDHNPDLPAAPAWHVARTFTYGPANAADGSNGTRWWAQEGDKNPWIQFDLGKVKKITTAELYFIFPTNGQAWELEKSIDGKNWTTCNTQNTLRSCSPHLANHIGKARYLRVNIRQGAPGLWECRLY